MMDDQKRFTLQLVTFPLPAIQSGGKPTRVGFMVVDNNIRKGVQGVEVTLQLKSAQSGAPVVSDTEDAASWGASAVSLTEKNGLVYFYVKAGSLGGRYAAYAIVQHLHDGLHRVDISLEVLSGVTQLVIVSGDKQFALLDGSEFAVLDVQALNDKGRAVMSAQVQFDVEGGTGTNVTTPVVLTDEHGRARVWLNKGTVPGLFTVMARCGHAAPVSFHLALGTKASQLELKTQPAIVLDRRSFNPRELKVTLQTRGGVPPVVWPYAAGYVMVDGPVVLEPNTSGPLSLHSNTQGELVMQNNRSVGIRAGSDATVETVAAVFFVVELPGQPALMKKISVSFHI